MNAQPRASIKDTATNGQGPYAAGRSDQGETAMSIVLDGAVAGLVSIADPVKDTTPDAPKALNALGLRIVMATGDSE